VAMHKYSDRLTARWTHNRGRQAAINA
jgi:hypothetical protein